MKTRFFLIISLVLLLSGCSEDTIDVVGQGILTGRVVSDLTDEPLANVKISTNPASTTVFTDADGRFTIDPVDVDDYSVQAELDSYTTAFEAVSIEENRTSDVFFELIRSEKENKAPLAPINLFPEDKQEGLGTNVEFVWSSASNDEDSITYEVELRNALTGTLETYTVVNDTTLTVENLILNTKYFWQVSALDDINDEVQGSLSEFSTYKTGQTPYLFTRIVNSNSVIYAGSTEINEGATVEFPLTDLAKNSFRPRANIQAGKIAFLRTVGGLTHLFTMNLDGSEMRQLTNTVPINGFRLDEIDFTWAQNGTKLYYPSFDKLYSIDVNGGGAQLIYQTNDGNLISEVTDSEFDDNLIAVKTNNNEGYNVRIYTVRLSSQLEETIVLEGVAGAAGGLDLDANGQKLLFTHDLSGSQNNQYRIFQSRLFVYDLNSNSMSQLDTDVDTGQNDLDPRWSPSEGEIILTRKNNTLGSNSSIFQIDLDVNNVNDNADDLLFTNASMPDWE